MNRPDLAPVFPSEHVPHRRLPGPTGGVSTLKVNRALTLSCNVSAITRSNWVRTFMASCGSIRSSPINSSRASVRATPRLGRQGQPSALFPWCAQTRAAAESRKSTFHDDTNRNSWLLSLPSCLFLSPLFSAIDSNCGCRGQVSRVLGVIGKLPALQAAVGGSRKPSHVMELTLLRILGSPVGGVGWSCTWNGEA
jgi:hypothetical protein